MEWLKAIAPTVATVLAGPMAGLAVSAIGDAFGLSDATKEKVEAILTSGSMTSEQLSALRQVEGELKLKEQELGLKFEALIVDDRKDARQREVLAKDNTNRILAFSIVGAFIATVGATLLGWTKAESVLAGTLIGYLSAKAEQVLAYYFGSTKGSADKTAAIVGLKK